MKKIELTQGQYALVDDSDYEALSKHEWQAARRSNGQFSYAIRTEYKPKKRTVYMHVELTGLVKTDHKDGNGFNNQRYNLRSATNLENARNTSKASNRSSQYKGVSYRKDRGYYRAYIRDNGKLVNLGSFGQDEVSAAQAYDNEALKRFGSYARLNFTIEKEISL